MNHPVIRLLLLSLAFLHPASGQISLPGGAEAAKVTASIVSEVKTAAPGQPFRAAVKLVHQDHWHTYGKVLPPEVIGKPTKLKWTLPEGWTVEELTWPATKEVDSTDGKKSQGYEGTVHLPVKITPVGKVGDAVEISVKVDALACNPENCMPVKPEAKLTLTLADKAEIDPANSAVFAQEAVTPAAAAPTTPVAKIAERSFGGYLLFAFIGGLILNVMPCVFPVLGIKVLSVVQQAGENKKQVLFHGLAYTFGVLVCFWALGALVITLGKGWGFQLQDPGFVFGLAAFFLIFALSMAGVFEIGTSAIGVGQNLQSQHGLGGSFFSGLLAVVVATPCSAPFLGSALGYAVTLSITSALMMFSMLGLGLASPFLLLAMFPRFVSMLPRPGAWMENFKQGLSFLLFGTAVFEIWVLSGMVEGQPLLFVMLSLVLIAFGCWVYGRWHLPHKSSRTRMIALVIALGCLIGGIAVGWPEKNEQPVKQTPVVESGLTWEVWSPEKVSELVAAQTPVYIDYTAKWCVTCQFNKHVYKNEALKKLIAEKKVVLLKADWTNEDPRITKALFDLGKAAVPVNVLYIPGKKDPVVLPELLSVENVSEALRQLGK
jgi:thiol:disulfide interchange protein